jgi:hypothetical protein
MWLYPQQFLPSRYCARNNAMRVIRRLPLAEGLIEVEWRTANEINGLCALRHRAGGSHAPRQATRAVIRISPTND